MLGVRSAYREGMTPAPQRTAKPRDAPRFPGGVLSLDSYSWSEFSTPCYLLDNTCGRVKLIFYHIAGIGFESVDSVMPAVLIGCVLLSGECKGIGRKAVDSELPRRLADFQDDLEKGTAGDPHSRN